ncbi:ASCH domain-containing protein [Aciduricibacillus chroicocephali]|uniref:ASCH domain-containing protein n=1 Tax=Aciduricibacillus chroicocephali TaxID=3054939 RepID=A0ABY9KZ99_9BACI|nr:ASCH domain-containing protein [Bacillaceae bacterium 44XB]
MENKSVVALWSAYKENYLDAPESYEAWGFGDSPAMADDLARLVVEGTKTATASNHALYEIEQEPLPVPGLINIILDGQGKAVAVIETTNVQVMPFHEVTEEHAYLEGEGDRSLAYWRSVHESFFKKELEANGLVFNEDMLVVCERFKVVMIPE